MMRKPFRFDVTYYVHWILFVAALIAVIGIVVQVVRFGDVIEPGSIGPAGANPTAVRVSAPSSPVGPESH